MRIRQFLTLGAAIILIALSASPVEAGEPISPDEPFSNHERTPLETNR